MELEHYADRTGSDLTSLSVALDELGEALDQSGGSESFIDPTDDTLWRTQLFDLDQGPEAAGRTQSRAVTWLGRSRLRVQVPLAT